MEKKHTPGPWKAVQQTSPGGKSLGWIIKHKNGRIGWSDYATLDPNQGESAPHHQGEANAYVMSAAPDLLATLKILAELMRKDGVKPSSQEDLALFAAQLAIAKAEGRE